MLYVMLVRVRVYVCTFILHVCIHVCLYVRMRVYLHVCMCIRTCTCLQVHTGMVLYILAVVFNVMSEKYLDEQVEILTAYNC